MCSAKTWGGSLMVGRGSAGRWLLAILHRGGLLLRDLRRLWASFSFFLGGGALTPLHDRMTNAASRRRMNGERTHTKGFGLSENVTLCQDLTSSVRARWVNQGLECARTRLRREQNLFVARTSALRANKSLFPKPQVSSRRSRVRLPGVL